MNAALIAPRLKKETARDDRRPGWQEKKFHARMVQRSGSHGASSVAKCQVRKTDQDSLLGLSD